MSQDFPGGSEEKLDIAQTSDREDLAQDEFRGYEGFVELLSQLLDVTLCQG